MNAPSQDLALYDRMCTAIAECSRVDEAKEIRDKSMALEIYYRQARNLEAEREAANVRLRAERRVGELLKDLARAGHAEAGAAGGVAKASVSDGVTRQPPPPSAYAAALSEQGMSRQQASRYQALADIPEPVFEKALAAPEKPTTAGLLKQAEARNAVRTAGTPVVSDEALKLWGHLREFGDDGIVDLDLDHVLTRMTDQMRADLKRLVPEVSTFLKKLENACERA